jgi:hypothetical protein
LRKHVHLHCAGKATILLCPGKDTRSFIAIWVVNPGPMPDHCEGGSVTHW